MPDTTLDDEDTVEAEREKEEKGEGRGERERWREIEGGRWGGREGDGKRKK